MRDYISRSINSLLNSHITEQLILIVTLIFVGVGGFVIGRMSLTEPVSVSAIEATVHKQESGVVASQSGSKYHLPWCSGAQRIKDENKLEFDSPEGARIAGYEPASNCKGLE